MKVKASSVKRRAKAAMSAQANSQPNTVENLTITSRIKRPDIVRQVAENRNSRPRKASESHGKRSTRNLGTGTKTRQKAYIPGGRKNNSTLYWVLGGLGAFCLFIFIAIVVAVSGNNNRPAQRTVSTPTNTPTRKVKRSNTRYGPGSWAEDPEVRAAIEGSTLYKNRQNAKKNYKKNR